MKKLLVVGLMINFLGLIALWSFALETRKTAKSNVGVIGATLDQIRYLTKDFIELDGKVYLLSTEVEKKF